MKTFKNYVKENLGEITLNEGTSCLIGLEKKDGTIVAINNPYDSGLKDAGKTLKKRWAKADKLQKLFAQGEVRSLAGTVKGSEFYARDMGEPLRPIKTYANRKAFEKEKIYDYLYLFVEEEGKWYYNQRKDWVEL